MDVKAVVSRMKAAVAVATDSELASRIGVPFATLNSWKKRNSIPVEKIENFSDDFDCSLDWLIFGRHAQDSVTAIEKIGARAYQLGVAMALKTSDISSDQAVKINENIDFYRRLIAAQVSFQIENSNITLEEAFEALENALHETPGADRDAAGANSPNWPKKVVDQP